MKSGALRVAMMAALGVGVFGFLLVPHQAQAQDRAEDLTVTDLFTGGYWGGASDPAHPLIPCTGIYNFVSLRQPGLFFGATTQEEQSIAPNQIAIKDDQGKTIGYLPPCQSLCDILAAVQRIIYFLFTILMYVIVPVFVFLGGGKLLISGANPAKRAEAIKTIVGSLVGLGIGFGAFLIVTTFLWLIFTNNGATTNFTYQGDALSKTTQGTRITWPTISCQPNAYNQIQPSSYQESSEASCKQFCSLLVPPRSATFSSSTSPQCKCGDIIRTCTPACSSTQECKEQAGGNYRCVDKAPTGNACTSAGGACIDMQGRPGCNAGETFVQVPAGTCPASQLCCKKPATADDSACKTAGGNCIDTASCDLATNNVRPGLCKNQPNNIKCCVPKATASACIGTGGRCTGGCHGTCSSASETCLYYTPDPSKPESVTYACTIPRSTADSCQGLRGQCVYRKRTGSGVPSFCTGGPSQYACSDPATRASTFNESCYDKLDCR